MPHLLLFGPGYCGRAIAALVEAEGWTVTPVGRATPAEAVRTALGRASHILSTVPPEHGSDQVLHLHRDAIGRTGAWIGYLSSTGVYGDTGGAWVDETAALAGRRGNRMEADLAWRALGARVFRLPGIYGPGRSVFDRLADGRAHRVDLPAQIFSRIHVADLAAGVRAAMAAGPAGIFNLADELPAPQNAVVEEACRLAGWPLPPLLAADDPALGPGMRAFYAENRRVAAGKAHRLLGWRPRFPTYREGLRDLIATARPATASPAPPAAGTLQR